VQNVKIAERFAPKHPTFKGQFSNLALIGTFDTLFAKPPSQAILVGYGLELGLSLNLGSDLIRNYFEADPSL